MLRHFKILLKTILLSLTVSACGTIPIHDYIFYGDQGRFGAVGLHTLFTTIPPVFIEKPEWDIMRIGMSCTLTSNITDMQANIDKLCSENPNVCIYDEMQQLRAALASIVRLQNFSIGAIYE